MRPIFQLVFRLLLAATVAGCHSAKPPFSFQPLPLPARADSGRAVLARPVGLTPPAAAPVAGQLAGRRPLPPLRRVPGPARLALLAKALPRSSGQRAGRLPAPATRARPRAAAPQDQGAAYLLEFLVIGGVLGVVLCLAGAGLLALLPSVTFGGALKVLLLVLAGLAAIFVLTWFLAPSPTP